jgi:hypothetical protein
MRQVLRKTTKHTSQDETLEVAEYKTEIEVILRNHWLRLKDEI